MPGYIGAQVAGAVLGAVAILGVLGKKASDVGLGVASYAHISWTQAFTAEFIGTFILVFTVFGVIHRKAAAGFAGLAIGFVVFAVIIPVAPATGASINPARTFGPMLVQQLAGRPGEVEPDPRVPESRSCSPASPPRCFTACLRALPPTGRSRLAASTSADPETAPQQTVNA